METLGHPSGDDWIAVAHGPLPVGEVSTWASHRSCGAVVCFTGTSRDHSVGRSDVRLLEYEAYTEQVVPRLEALAGAMRSRWPELCRVALLHRLGEVPLAEASVVVAVSAPHRAEAFDAARHGIDALKSTVPIWKREVHAGGEDWALDAHPLADVDEVSDVGGPARAATRQVGPR